MFDKKEQGRWWDFGWQLVEGCTKISPACKNCWSLEKEKRFGIPADVIFHPERLDRPLKRKKPTSYAIWNDLFHESIPFDDINEVIRTIVACPQHVFIILTKRPERMRDFFNWKYDPSTHFEPYPIENIWLGTTAENQKTANERIPILLDIPAAKRFVSIEPMLGEIDLTSINMEIEGEQEYVDALDNYEGHIEMPDNILDWVIVGGESGHNARPMHPDWIRSIRSQCHEANVPFFFKQHGEWIQVGECGNSEDDQRYYDHSKCQVLNIKGGMGFHGENAIYMMKKGRSKTGSELDGQHHKDFQHENEH